MDAKNRDRAIRISELEEILGISRTSIRRLEFSGLLPKKRKFNGGVSCFYLESEILAYLKSQPQVDCNNKTTPQAA